MKSPPPVHWHTKPNVNQQGTQSNRQTSSLRPSQQSTSGLVPVYIHPDRLANIEAALRYLGLPPLLNLGGDQAPATAPSHEDLNRPVPSQFQQRNSPQPVIGHERNAGELDHSDLTTSFSQLSTSELGSNSRPLPDSFPARYPPQSMEEPVLSPRKDMKKYYVITVGKCTGIFWEEW